MSSSEEPKPGLCIVSFDSGGPGSISQLLILKEVMNRLEYERDLDENTLIPADHFDLFGAAGYGAMAVLFVGRLRMTPEEAIQELATIAQAVFPNEPTELATPRANMSNLQRAVENMLERKGFSTTIKLHDKRLATAKCKVVIFSAATETMGHCHAFRTYRSRYAGAPDCSFVDAACAAIADPNTFSPVSIGQRAREQRFCGPPMGSSNPIRAVLKEARQQFGEDTPISLLLSLGGGQSAPLSLHSSLTLPHGRLEFMARAVQDCERIANEISQQLSEVDAYLRLDVDKGLNDLKISDWHRLGAIETHTNVYIQSSPISERIDKALSLLQSTNGNFTLGDTGRASAAVAARARYQRQDRELTTQIRDIVQQGVDQITLEKITFIDAIGNRVPIPMQLCRTYEMLKDVVKLYFEHQRPPGSSFFERGQYELVQGPDRRAIASAEWDSTMTPGETVEMSIQLEISPYTYRGCPRCQTRFSAYGWTTCRHCQKPFNTRIAHTTNRVASQGPAMSPNGHTKSLDHEDADLGRFRLVTGLETIPPSPSPPPDFDFPDIFDNQGSPSNPTGNLVEASSNQEEATLASEYEFEATWPI